MGGREVYNASAGLSYLLLAWRRSTELTYTRLGDSCVPIGVNVSHAACRHVIVFDRQQVMKRELSDQVLVTVLMMLIIMLCIGLMALDMQLMLNPLERITKLIKLVTGHRWKKRMKELRKTAKQGGDSGLSALGVLEEIETEAYFGLRMIDLFFMDVEEAFSISMGKWRQKLWALELWFDKMFLFVNRIVMQAQTQQMTLEQLWMALLHLFTAEMPWLWRKIRKKGGTKLTAVLQVSRSA